MPRGLHAERPSLTKTYELFLTLCFRIPVCCQSASPEQLHIKEGQGVWMNSRSRQDHPDVCTIQVHSLYVVELGITPVQMASVEI